MRDGNEFRTEKITIPPLCLKPTYEGWKQIELGLLVSHQGIV